MTRDRHEMSCPHCGSELHTEEECLLGQPVAPCPSCEGAGCPNCDGTGMVEEEAQRYR
jgi:hypothetical protein